jgi:hypothetical protein
MNTDSLSPMAQIRMNRIKKIIAVIRWLISATVIYILVVGLFVLADLAGIHIMPSGGQISFSPGSTYSAPFKIPPAVLVLAFLRISLFFAGQNVRYIRLLGWFLLSDWVIERVLDAVAYGWGYIRIGELLLGLLIVLIAWVMDEGRKIQEEQELTV